MTHIQDMILALAIYDAAVKELDDYINTFYAPYALDEPITAGDRMYNENWYRHVNNLKVKVKRCNEDLIGVIRRELEGMT